MRIALVGKFTGELWRMEPLVQQALWTLGHECDGVRIPNVEAFQADWTEERSPSADDYAAYQVRQLDGIQDVDLTLVIQGYGLLPETIEALRWRTQRPVICWHGEILGSHWPTNDEVVQAKVAQLHLNVGAYDLVIHNCETSLGVLRQLGARRMACVPVSGVDPTMHRMMALERVCEVGIFGWPSTRRYELVKAVLKHLPEGTIYAWPDPNDPGSYGEGLMIFLNRVKVVLNVHYSPTLNTETRIYESLGCGTPVVSEPISMPALFPNGVGIAYGDTPESLAGQIQALLAMEAESYASLAKAGYDFVHAHYSYHQRCQQVLDVVAKELQ